MKKETMKGLISFVLLMIMNSAMAQQNPMAAVLADKLADYQAEADVKIDSLEDGTIKAARNYLGGETSLEIRISQPPAEQREEIKKQVDKLAELFLQMNDDGQVQAEKPSSAIAEGIFTFSDGVAGGIILVKNTYLLEYKVTGATSVENAKTVFESLDFFTF